MNVTLKMIGAEWCAPCKRVWPWVREIADQLTGDVACSYVSIEDYKGDDVLSVPTLIVLQDGQEVGRATRFSGKASLARGIRRMLETPQ
jgi:thioredoxin